MKVVFMPARSGSKRIINKNLHILNNHPLIATVIEAFKIFDKTCGADSESLVESFKNIFKL